MPQAYAPTPSPADDVRLPAPTPGDCDRISDLLTEIATIPALFAHGPAVTIVATSPYGLCAACSMDGVDRDATATLCRDPHLVLREPVCTAHLADVVAYEQRVSAPATLWVEIGLTIAAPVPSWKTAPRGCSCDPIRGQSCSWCDGTDHDDATTRATPLVRTQLTGGAA